MSSSSRLAVSFAVLCLGLALAPAPARSQDRSPHAWISDLHHLVRSIREIHPDPFRNVSEADFQFEVNRIQQEIPDLADHERVVAFMRLVALLQDGHSAVRPGNQPGFGLQYPVVIYPFEDGVYLSGAAAEYGAFVGARVTRIGTLPTDRAIERLKPMINGENAFTILDRIPRFLTYPLVLHALGISDERDRLTLRVETAGGERKEFTVAPVFEPFFTFVGPEVTSANAARARQTNDTPLHLKRLTDPFWFEHVEEQDLVYVQFNQVRNAVDETFDHFCSRLFTFVDENRVETVVLDMRYNHGGNNQLVQPLIHGAIRRNHGFNRSGHFYTIIGRGTFSAAISTVAWLEEHTAVRFAGEPTGSAPIHFGDADRITLPETGLEVQISDWEWQMLLPWDDRAWFAPQVPAPPTFVAYREGRDPAMEAILADIDEPSLEETLLGALHEGGPQAVAPAYRAYKERHPDRWLTTEAQVNRLGYELLGREDHAAAIAVFRLNTESYPGSANTWDSLAEAHLNAGDRARAVELYRKALQVNPDFTNARRMLDRLEGEGSPSGDSGH